MFDPDAINSLATEKLESTSKLFGRKWKVSILEPISESDVETEYTAHVVSDSDYEDTSLRVTFNIQKFWTMPNYSEVCVYNLAPDLENMIVKRGWRVIVQAGYVNGAFGTIYHAPIFQPLWEREDTVTSKLTLRCIDAMDVIYQNHVATVGTVMQHQKDMVAKMMSEARVPSKITQMSDTLEDNVLPRPKIYFDAPIYYMRKYAQQSGTLPSVSGLNTYIMKPTDVPTQKLIDEAIPLFPGLGGLVGTPQQTQNGISFTCLLNPNIDLFSPNPMLVKLDKAVVIKQLQLTQGDEKFSILDKDGVYKVIGLTHIGDTRGQSWYTNVNGVDQSLSGTAGAMFQTTRDTIQG